MQYILSYGFKRYRTAGKKISRREPCPVGSGMNIRRQYNTTRSCLPDLVPAHTTVRSHSLFLFLFHHGSRDYIRTFLTPCRRPQGVNTSAGARRIPLSVLQIPQFPR